MTDKEAVRELKAMGLGDFGSAFHVIQDKTCLVRRDAYDDSERHYGYRGPWYPNPDLKAVLEQLGLEGEI